MRRKSWFRRHLTDIAVFGLVVLISGTVGVSLARTLSDPIWDEKGELQRIENAGDHYELTFFGIESASTHNTESLRYLQEGAKPAELTVGQWYKYSYWRENGWLIDITETSKPTFFTPAIPLLLIVGAAALILIVFRYLSRFGGPKRRRR